jgi:hypothetical protein
VGGGGDYVERRTCDAFILMPPVRNIVESVEGGSSRREKPCHGFIKMIAKHLTINAGRRELEAETAIGCRVSGSGFAIGQLDIMAVLGNPTT